MFKFSLEILDLRMNVGIVQMVGSRSHSHQFVALLLIMGREMDLSPERFPSFSHGEFLSFLSLCVAGSLWYRPAHKPHPSLRTTPLVTSLTSLQDDLRRSSHGGMLVLAGGHSWAVQWLVITSSGGGGSFRSWRSECWSVTKAEVDEAALLPACQYQPLQLPTWCTLHHHQWCATYLPLCISGAMTHIGKGIWYRSL